MRTIRLSGREATVVRAIGFTQSILGEEIQGVTNMQVEDVADTLNALIAAGFVDSIPYCEQVGITEVSKMSFELNPAYAQQLKSAIRR